MTVHFLETAYQAFLSCQFFFVSEEETLESIPEFQMIIVPMMVAFLFLTQQIDTKEGEI